MSGWSVCGCTCIYVYSAIHCCDSSTSDQIWQVLLVLARSCLCLATPTTCLARSDMDLMSSSNEDNEDEGPKAKPKSCAAKRERRPRPCNDLADVKQMAKDFKPLLNLVTGQVSLDFRSYGKMIRTGGCGPCLN